MEYHSTKFMSITHAKCGTTSTVRSTVVERATYMRVYAGSSPTSVPPAPTIHRKELI